MSILMILSKGEMSHSKENVRINFFDVFLKVFKNGLKGQPAGGVTDYLTWSVFLV